MGCSEMEEFEMEQSLQARRDFRQLQTWEQQIKESYNPGPNGKDNEDGGIRLEVLEAGGVKTTTKARNNPGEARGISSQQKQRQVLLSLGPGTEVPNDPNHNSKLNQQKKNHGFWHTKMWRQNLFKKYVNLWNGVDEDKCVETNYTDDLENSPCQELEDFASDIGEGEGCQVEKENRQKDSEHQYFEALRHWATRSTIKQEENCGGTLVGTNEEKQTPQDEGTNTSRSLQARRGHETEGSRTFGRRGSRETPQDSEKIPGTSTSLQTIAVIRPGKERGGDLKKTEDTKTEGGCIKLGRAAETEGTRTFGRRGSQISTNELERFIPSAGPSQPSANIRPGKELGGAEQKIEDGKRDGGPDQLSLKSSEIKPRSRQPEGGKLDRTESQKKEVLQRKARIQGVEINLDDDITILQKGRNSMQSEGRKPNNRAGESKAVPFKGRGEMQGPESRNEGNIVTVESERLKKLEAFESKGSKRSEMNIIPRKEGNRRGKRSTKEIVQTQDPKGYNDTNKTGGKDSSGQSVRQEKQDKGRQQEWSQVDWTACDTDKRLAAAAVAPSLQHRHPRNAAEAIKQRKWSSVEPRHRTIYRVKDTYCKEVRGVETKAAKRSQIIDSHGLSLLD